MADTYKALSTVTVGAGGSSTITFSNIPQTYTDLRIVLSARTDRSGFPNDNIRVYPNGSSSRCQGKLLDALIGRSKRICHTPRLHDG